MPFDLKNSHRKTGYCDEFAYCNIWSKDFFPNGLYKNNTKSGIVSGDSTLKQYLNNEYYINVLHENTNIVEGIYNVGPDNSETSYTWIGNIALLSISEYNIAGAESSYLKKPYIW